MTEFLIYVIRWGLVLTMLYSLYGLFLKRETLHGFNRVVLLVILATAMVLPLCKVTTKERNFLTESRERLEKQISEVNMVLANEAPATDEETAAVMMPVGDEGAVKTMPATESGKQNRRGSLLLMVLIGIYLVGLVVAWARYLWSLAALVRLIRQGKRLDIDGLPKGVKVLVHKSVKAPCSWMRWVLLSPDDAKELSPALMRHELSHIHYGHSWDMLCCEWTCRMLWCVPFAWMLRQDMRDVHEFQADRRVLSSGIDENEYQLLLIRKATGTGLQPVVNALNQSPIKRRFKMMYTKPSRRWVALKATYLLPLSALAIVAFARPQTLDEIEKHVEETAPVVTETVAEAVKTVVNYEGSVSYAADEPAQAEQPHADDVDKLLETADGNQVLMFADSVITGADDRLVRADLAEQTGAVQGARRLANYRDLNDLMDSVMQAIGARKIYEGCYVGHFQPNLNSDTVRIFEMSVLDRKSHVTMATGIKGISDKDPLAYKLTLQQETRKDRTGYYMRYLQPLNSNVRHYDRKTVDPKMLSTDSVLTGRGYLLSHYPVAIERGKNETRIYMYTWMAYDLAPFEMAPLKNDYAQNILKAWQWHICDAKTNDRYMLRSMDDSYLKFVEKNVEGNDTSYVYQVCLVFPPLDKHVDEAYLGIATVDGNYRNITSTFSIKALPRKGRVIVK